MSALLRAAIIALATMSFGSMAITPALAQKAKQEKSKTTKAKSSSSSSKSADKSKKTSSPTKSTSTKPKKTAKTKKPTSPCQGLTKSSCEGKKDLCSWISPKKKVDTRGRKLKAYCRKTGGFAKAKKTDTKKTSAKKTTTKASRTTKASAKKPSTTKAAKKTDTKPVKKK